MSDRAPCCIRGCQRAFPAKHRGSMCGKHWRAVRQEAPRKAQLLKEALAVVRKVKRRGFYFDPWREVPEYAERLPDLYAWARPFLRGVWMRYERRWKAVVAEAQRLQDAGFFAPKPRRRQKNHVPSVDRMVDIFNKEFGRAKERMVAGGRR